MDGTEDSTGLMGILLHKYLVRFNRAHLIKFNNECKSRKFKLHFVRIEFSIRKEKYCLASIL